MRGTVLEKWLRLLTEYACEGKALPLQTSQRIPSAILLLLQRGRRTESQLRAIFQIKCNLEMLSEFLECVGKQRALRTVARHIPLESFCSQTRQQRKFLPGNF